MNKNKIDIVNVKSSVQDKKQKNDIQEIGMNFINNPTELNFSRLVKRSEWGLKDYIFKIVNNNTSTNEIYNMVLEKIWFKRECFKDMGIRFSVWMYTIAHNVAMNYIRDNNSIKKSYVPVDLEDMYDSCLNADSDSEYEERESGETLDIVFINSSDGVSYDKEKLLCEVYDASISRINEMPDNIRIVMYDKIVNGKSIIQISEDNEIPVSSVKNWLRKGWILLREGMRDEYSYLYDIYYDEAV